MVLAVSASTASAVRDLGVPRQRVEVLPPGVDVLPMPRRDRGTLCGCCSRAAGSLRRASSPRSR